MTYEDLIDNLKMDFYFCPDEEFKNVSQVIEGAIKKTSFKTNAYTSAALQIAQYIDEKEILLSLRKGADLND